MSVATLGVEFDPIRDKIRRKTRVTPDGCWFWEAYKSPDGYGRLQVPGMGQLAHRVSYLVFVGPIPEGTSLDHLCRNRACVNPAHLEPVSWRENILRGEGVAAHRARQTHCKRGHEFVEENVYRFPNGRRGCRTCRAESSRRRYLETKC